MDKSVRFVAALAIIAVFINAASPGNYLGVWYYDSGIYIQQGYDILGGRPPVYPVFLQLVGRNVVHYQIVLGVISWCLLGYLLAGFPGLILGGILIISPWFARWHGNCLTESFSHSFAALALAFSILLIRNRLWTVPWLISLLLFAFTRFSNVLILPFLSWPVLFVRDRTRWLVIGGLVVVLIPAALFLHSRATEIGDDNNTTAAAGHLISSSSHSAAFQHLINVDSRPYFGSRTMSEDRREYLPELSFYSQWFKWLELPRYSYLWPLLLILATLIMIRHRSPNIRYVVIISLFLAGYLQCLFNVMYQDTAGGPTEVWRHLAICDAFFAFSVITFAGMLTPQQRERSSPKEVSSTPDLRRKKTGRAASWALTIAGMAAFTAVIYSPDRFKPAPHEYGRAFRSQKGKIIREYIDGINSRLAGGWSTSVSCPHSADRSTWDHKVRPTCWIFANERERELTWRSQPFSPGRRTTVVFGGILSGKEGEFRLYVNDRATLVFNSAPESTFQEWRNRGFKLAFFAFRGEPGRAMFGTFCLTLPEDEEVGGEPLLFRVEGIRGGREGYFMLEQSADTLTRLGLSRR